MLTRRYLIQIPQNTQFVEEIDVPVGQSSGKLAAVVDESGTGKALTIEPNLATSQHRISNK